MIISSTSLKGGVGKSTLAINLAVYLAHKGYKVCLIDTDTNQSSSQWSGLRPDDLPDITVVGMMDTKQLSRNINSLNNDYDYVILDGVPALSKMTSHIILLSDLVLIPIVVSALDLWAIDKYIERFEEAKLLRQGDIPAYFILNMYDPRLNLSKEFVDVLLEYDIKPFEHTIRNRVAYRESLIQGRGVMEYKDPKAQAEMTAIGEEFVVLSENLMSHA